jgi:hypothetical protein
VNEVEPWSSRARRVLGAGASRAGRSLERAWAWFTDLGQGAWMLALGVAVAGALVLAIIHGRNDSGGTPCQHAEPDVMRMQSLTAERHHRLDDADIAVLRDASARLTAIAGSAFGDDVAAIELAARTAAVAKPGHRMNARVMVAKFDQACGYGGSLGTGFGTR